LLVILGLLAWVGGSLVVAEYVVGFIMVWLLGDKISEPTYMAVYSGLAYAAAGALIIFVPWRIKKKWGTTREEVGLLGAPTWTDIGLSVVGFGAYFVLAAVVVAIFSLFPWFDAGQAQDVGFSGLADVGQKLVAFLALVIIAPIAEEMIFRGWLYGKMRKRTNMWVAMLVVSALFGLMHGQWNVGVNVFAMSLIMCGMREITGTIWGGIILHMIKNGVAFYFLFVVAGL
jgi:membrane protease YdiL (CAAX protease family)